MKRALAYEFKRILLPLCIFTAIATAVFAVAALTSDFIALREIAAPGAEGSYSTVQVPVNTLVHIPAITLCVLCFIVPAMQFSYRMKRRSVDLWYALPVKREKLVLARVLGGLALVFVPYAVSYAAGVTVIACSENLFKMQMYVPLFFASLPMGVLLFGVNSFLFSRANTAGDGIVFMLLGAFALAMPMAFADAWLWQSVPNEIDDLLHYITFGPAAEMFMLFGPAIRGARMHVPGLWIACVLAAIEGCAAYFGLFYTARSHRAESAGQISDSPFGYKVLLPWYLFFGIATASVEGGIALTAAPIAEYLFLLILAFVGYFVYRRSFRLKLSDIIGIGGAFAGSLLLALICSWVSG